MAPEGGEWRVKFGPEGKRALTFWNDLFNKHKVFPLAILELGSSGAREGFMQGKFSQLFGQEYYIGIYNAEGGDSFQWNKEWSAQAMPIDKHRSINHPRTQGYAIAENSKHKDIAWEFVKFMSSTEAQLVWFSTHDPKLAGVVPTRKSVINHEQFDVEDYEWPLLKYLLLDEDYHHIPIVHPAFQQFDSQVFKIGVEKMMLGEFTVDEAIEWIETEGNKVIEEFKAYE
jgi:ABC-type glycerol-3-phosphate transport system substrate-binding protein